MTCRIESNNQTIAITGSLEERDFRRFLAALHERTQIKGYQDIALDFNHCTAAFPGPMLAIASAA